MCDEGAKPANWEKWAQLIDVEVWEAVALSFGAEPETIRGLDLDWRDDDPFEDCQDDFRLKLKIACNHIESGALPAKWARKTPFRKVKLVDFSEWACAPPRNWTLPKRFPRKPDGECARSGDANQSLPPSAPSKSAALPRSEPAALDTANQLRPAPRAMVDEAISAVYDEAEELGAKPPNVNELVTPVQSKLRGKGLFAGKPLIQDLAGDLKHASRRRPIGARLKNKKM